MGDMISLERLTVSSDNVERGKGLLGADQV